MKINEKVKKCVAYIQWKLIDGTYENKGTICFVGRDTQEKQVKYAVTAKHVIKGIQSKGHTKAFVRVNIKEGATRTIETNINDWIFHEDENVDIAVIPMGLPDEIDHLFYPESAFLNDVEIQKNEIDCGDEVFITGLFKHHHGRNKNIPIVRVGNIAMMPGEKVQTRFHLMDAYLIESRSIGGLSGSPVFINYGLIRKLEGEIKYRLGDDLHNLLGFVYGHYDSNIDDIDHIASGENNNKVNVGIAIVTPVSKLAELFSSQTIKSIEQNIH